MPTTIIIAEHLNHDEAIRFRNLLIDTTPIFPNIVKNDSIKYSMMGIDKEFCMTSDFNKSNTIINLLLIHKQDSLRYKLHPFDTLGSSCFPCDQNNNYRDTIVIKNSVYK